MGIMVYRAIGYNYKSPLIVCERSITDIDYHNIISKNGMFEELDHKYNPGGNNCIYKREGFFFKILAS